MVYVNDWMVKNFLVESETCRLHQAIKLLKNHNQSLLVLKNDQDQVFVLTAPMIKNIPEEDSNHKITHYADHVDFFGKKTWSIYECISTMRTHKKDYLLIKEDSQIIGLITIENLFIMLHEFGWEMMLQPQEVF